MGDKIKLVMMDIDGTIVNSPHDRSVTKEMREAVRRVADRGIRIGLASGRNYGHVIAQMGEVGFTGPYICNNGAFVVDNGEVYSEALLPGEVIDAAWGLAESLKCYVEFSGRKVMHTCMVPGYTGQTFPGDRPGDYLDTLEYSVHIPRRMRKKHISKITLAVDSREKAAVIERFFMCGELREKVSLSSSFWYCLEVTCRGISKGSGLCAIAEKSGILMSEVVAIGDGDNDAEMLKAAGISFAMGNASTAAAAAAKYRTASVKEDGARKVLERYVLGEELP